MAEGLANEARRFIQDTRKAVGLDVSDRIKLSVAGADEITAAVKAHEKRIMDDTLAVAVSYSDAPLEHKTEIEGREFSLKMEKA